MSLCPRNPLVHRRALLLGVLSVFALGSLALPTVGLSDDASVDYARDIKPLLSANCYACHGPDAKQRKADLRLDERDDALDVAIVPGDAAASPLIERVLSADPEERMPPASSKKPLLEPDQIELLRRWIDEGAAYDLHWSYVKLDRPAEPPVADAAWPLNRIDHFIAAVHRARRFQSSPEADRRTLIRRLSFDLIGLPPTPEQVDQFITEDSPQAYENLVDRLLASENFGERLAMFWLDLVRYADTNGIHSDNHREHDLYRDYVINAFNENKPFDQFTIEQLAGDLIENPTKEQRVASGYNRLNLTTQEGGAQPKEYIAKYAADRVRNASVVWMGSTLGCAECHDHKFDPFSTKDFYSFAAFFADIQETPVGAQQPVRLPTDEQEQQLARIDEQLAAIKKVLDTQTPELDAALVKWEIQARADLAKQTPSWLPVKPVAALSSGGATLTVQDDLSVLSSGANPVKDTYTVTIHTEQENITGVRLEALTHESLTNQSLSRANGNFVLTRFEVESSTDSPAQPVKIKTALASYAQQGFPIANAIDGKPDTGWAVEGHAHKADRTAVFAFDPPIAGGSGTTITIHMRHESQYSQHNIGRFRLSLTSSANPSLDGEAGLPAEIAQLLSVDRGQRTGAQTQHLAKYFREVCEELAVPRSEVEKLEAQKKTITDSFRPILVSMSVTPREMRILPRGNWLDDSGEIVRPGVPEFLGKLEVGERRATRMDLAQWLVRPDNPLVARVMVNRLWKLFYGRGLVTSLDDYGAQGTVPSHPELLDWLAVEFIDSGWDVKHIVKLMVTSRTYRQSSLESKELRQRDPANQWLARQNRFRLPAELIRDNALAISGLLVNQLGGPSVKPYQPAGYWDHLNFPRRTWQHDTGENQYRRGMYTYWCRTFPHPSLLAFDAQSREESCVQRPRSNTPLQALVLLNDPTYVEAARVFATRMMQEGGASIEQRLTFAFREAIGRRPTDDEVAILAALYNKHLDAYRADSASAAQSLTAGESKPPADLDVAELAAWTSVARTVLNLHETITRN